ncbi:MATE family efflux transporter [Intestinimonas sp.]|uniref:MATE family efflux transporter n=1 Tax=Intestinimonas sp. TaxID=1965293 RepID=UPI00262F661F|nr:MATE family efflux transporter [Intestinimonas sp.]
MKRENDLGRDPIRSLVLRVALPSMLAQFVSVFYSIVDRMYIGNIPEIGDTALAGVGICGPIVTLVGAFAFLVGVGGAPLMSIKLGEGDRDAAERILANCFLMLLVLSAVLTAVSLLIREKLLMWFGASTVTFPYANAYITIYLMGTVFALMSSGLNQFIVCQGFANAGMRSVLLGAVLNIVLDPILIFLLDMGVQGAALATVISQMASCAYVLLFLFGRRPPVRITFGHYRLKTVRSVLTVGMTSFLIIAMDNVMIIAMNAILQKYGGAGEGDMLVTCATIMQSFMLMITMPLGGITGGTQSILGFNYGACRPDRVLEAQKYIAMLCVAFTTIFFLIAQLIPQSFVLIFTRDPDYVATASRAIRIFTLGIIPMGLQYTIVDGFTGMGVVRASLPLSFWRKGLYFVSLFALPALFGAQAVFLTGPIADFGGAAVSVLVYRLTIQKILGKRTPSTTQSA